MGDSITPCVRSVSAKKRKEKLLSLPSNVSKLGFKAKRIISESLKNEAELVVSWLPACDSLSTDVDIVDDEVIGHFAKSLELRHKIAHLKSIFGGGSKVSDDEPGKEEVRSFEFQGTVDGTNEGVAADDTVRVVLDPEYEHNGAKVDGGLVIGATHQSKSTEPSNFETFMS